VDVTRELRGVDGTPLALDDGSPATVRAVVTAALVSHHAQEAPQPDGVEKFRRYRLAVKVTEEDRPELTLGERKTILDLVALMYAPLVCGQVWELLDPGEDSREMEEAR